MPKKEVKKEKRSKVTKVRRNKDAKDRGTKDKNSQNSGSEEIINPLEKYTRFLRTQYLRNIKNFTIYLSIALVASIGISVLFDFLVPFSSWGNVARAIVVLVDSVIFFSAGYLANFFFYMSQRAVNPDYVDLKERFSPSWRNRIAIIIGAVLFTMMLTVNQGLAYTIVSSIIVASVVGIVVFISRTEEEREREFYGVPDKRDDAYRDALEDVRKKRESRQKKKKGKDGK